MGEKAKKARLILLCATSVFFAGLVGYKALQLTPLERNLIPEIPQTPATQALTEVSCKDVMCWASFDVQGISEQVPLPKFNSNEGELQEAARFFYQLTGGHPLRHGLLLKKASWLRKAVAGEDWTISSDVDLTAYPKAKVLAHFELLMGPALDAAYQRAQKKIGEVAAFKAAEGQNRQDWARR